MRPKARRRAPRRPRPARAPVCRRCRRPPTDKCPATPAGAVELVDGCSAVELARRPELLFGDALAGAAAAVEAIDAGSFASARPPIDSATQALLDASAALARGEVCSAATLAQRADRAVATSESALLDALAQPAPPAAAAGNEVAQSAALQLRAALAQQNLRAVHAAAASAQQLCDAVVGPYDAHARIDRIESQAGIAHLADGTTVALAPAGATQHAFAGRDAAIHGLRFADGTVLATRVDSGVASDVVAPAGLDSVAGSAGVARPDSTGGPPIIIGPPPPPIFVVNCLTLQAVPIQSGYPYDSGTVWNVTHPLSGYTDPTGTLQFEVGLGLTPVQSTATTYCPTWDAATGSSIVYSVSIVDKANGQAYTLASDMHDSDGVVYPVATHSPGASINATYYRRECKWFAGLTTCTAPTVLRTESYPINVVAQGAFAQVTYDKTIVGVMNQQAGYEHDSWFDTTHPIGYGTTAALPTDSNVKLNAFTAEGWIMQSNGTTAIAPVHIGTNFMLWSSDFTSIWSDPKTSQPLDHVGQDQPSGLRWAHVEGQRSGWPFWYSTRTPHVVRDLIAHCPLGPAAIDLTSTCGFQPAVGNSDSANDGEINPNAGQKTTLGSGLLSFYELPYAAGWSSSGMLGDMNSDDPTGAQQHGCNQIAAYDFGNTLGANLLAARGGTAVFLRSSYQVTDPKGVAVCGGNFLFIRHQDGTFAVYFHMKPEGVVPKVGDIVNRGQVVGFVGQTGCATGPHVHFEALSWPSSDWAGVRSMFRATHGGVTSNCYLPRAADTFISTTVQQ